MLPIKYAKTWAKEKKWVKVISAYGKNKTKKVLNVFFDQSTKILHLSNFVLNHKLHVVFSRQSLEWQLCLNKTGGDSTYTKAAIIKQNVHIKQCGYKSSSQTDGSQLTRGTGRELFFLKGCDTEICALIALQQLWHRWDQRA